MVTTMVAIIWLPFGHAAVRSAPRKAGATRVEPGAFGLFGPVRGKGACSILEPGDEIRIEWRLAGGIATCGLASRFVRFPDFQDLVQEPVGIRGYACDGYHEQPQSRGGVRNAAPVERSAS